MITVLHHADADGFGAAYALWKSFDREAKFIPVQYGQPVPEIPGGTDCLYIVDFSYDRETTLALARRFGFDSIVVIDHHKTAERELSGLPFAEFDMSKSGAVLTWEHVKPLQPVPPILRYVQDRDLWKFELPHSEDVNLYIASLPWDFEAWDRFDLTIAVEGGKAIRAFRGNQIKTAIRDARMMDFFGHLAPVVNCSANISEVGHELLKAYPAAMFAVMYCDRGDGQRSYSLRSRGDFDVAELCRAHGGGGHTAAAGFIRRFTVDGREFGHVRSFENHQRISGKEAQFSPVLPLPPDHSDGEAPGKHRGRTGEAQEGEGEKEKEKEESFVVGGGSVDTPREAPPVEADDERIEREIGRFKALHWSVCGISSMPPVAILRAVLARSTPVTMIDDIYQAHGGDIPAYRQRNIVERLTAYRWCNACCAAMAKSLYDDGEAWEERAALRR